jgi:hypothetical protein
MRTKTWTIKGGISCLLTKSDPRDRYVFSASLPRLCAHFRPSSCNQFSKAASSQHHLLAIAQHHRRVMVRADDALNQKSSVAPRRQCAPFRPLAVPLRSTESGRCPSMTWRASSRKIGLWQPCERYGPRSQIPKDFASSLSVPASVQR